MSIELSFPFTTASNYTLSDSDKIEIYNGVVRLKGQSTSTGTFTEPYNDTSGIDSYDNTKLTIGGGAAQQLSGIPNYNGNESGMATFTNSIDLTWNSVDYDKNTGTGVGSPTVGGGKLLLNSSSIKYVTYTCGFAISNTCTIRFKVIPRYTGSPSTQMGFLLLNDGTSSYESTIYIYHDTDGKLKVLLYNASGILIATQDYGTWSPTNGTEYEIEFATNTTNQYLFIDGTLIAGKTDSGTRSLSASSTILRLGSNLDGDIISNFRLDDLMIFTSIQNTTTYSPASYTAEYFWAASTVVFKQKSYSTTGRPISIVSTINDKDLDISEDLKYIINGLYWNGSIWTTSDGTIDQANTESEIAANDQYLSILTTLDLKMLLPNNNGVVGWDIASTAMNYSNEGYYNDNPYVEGNATWIHEGMSGFAQTATITGYDAVKYTLYKGSTQYYVLNGTWTTSDGTYSQASTAAEILADISDFTDGTVSVTSKFRAFLHSNNGNTTPELNTLTINYDYRGTTPDTINTCIVWAYQKNPDGSGDQTTVKIRFDDNAVQYKDKTITINEEYTITPDADGYWEKELIETANMSGTHKYKFYINNKLYLKSVPNETTKNFWDLS